MSDFTLQELIDRMTHEHREFRGILQMAIRAEERQRRTLAELVALHVEHGAKLESDHRAGMARADVAAAFDLPSDELERLNFDERDGLPPMVRRQLHAMQCRIFSIAGGIVRTVHVDRRDSTTKED
ncbi:hypothetical protein HED60_08815 [Planctomycetales bacterium ZRK34]|nr:hypothetical protein HED60_08815 [Planctomycetales bacterium ZRK34]